MLSVSDSKVYQSIACAPIKAMIRLLKTHFGTHKAGQGDTDLNIRYGHGGSQLSHNHSKQYGYVLQSLTLWLNLTSRMFYLWRCADNDLLSGAGYRLCNTGQGLNRVQACPSVSRATNAILRDVQAQVGGWIGLSVVHLGDRDVPNALMFIDKYTQVPRILAPIGTVWVTLGSLQCCCSSTRCLSSVLVGMHGGIAIVVVDFSVRCRID
eukprot:m.1584326 g.1584326  ORF g.1584326 m.1584326 type:complete len:209 (-) comp25320_c0_seq51:5023-5649(-)